MREINRAHAQGLNLYCNRRCSGFGRRKPKKSKAQSKLEKRLYDQQYLRLNREMLKAKKHAHHLATYDPEKERVKRKARMPQHVEYCRRPEYRRWKSDYDKRYRARKFYGPFAEAAMLTNDLNREIKERMTNHEIRWENRTTNKSQFRARQAKEEERSRPRHRNRRRDHSTAHG
jgi:RNA polymerase-interacting CarD/CdnL/TRCF family regulator